MLAEHHEAVDESAYQSWTVPQVAHWASSKLQTRMNNAKIAGGNPLHSLSESSTAIQGIDLYSDSSEDEYNQQRAIRSAIAILKRQRIGGASLAHLTLNHMLDFGIAFGVAVHLIACLDELVPNRMTDEEKAGGGEFPSWYESGSGGAATIDCETNVGEQEREMAERAQGIMKDRFGMTLPDLRDQNATKNGDKDARANVCIQKQPLPLETHAQSRSSNIDSRPHCGEYTDNSNMKDALNDQVTHSPSLSVGQRAMKEMLETMPPHVRAIAERRPDLVSKLLSEKNKQIQTSQFQQHHQQKVGPLETVSEDCIGYHSEEEINIDQERVSLLRRRTSNR